MTQTNATAKKTAESTDSEKPATIIIRTPDGPKDRITVDAAHHIVSDGKVLIYLDGRRNGVDLTESLANCHICRSDAGLRAHRGDATGDEDSIKEPAHDAQADSEIIVGSLTGEAD